MQKARVLPYVFIILLSGCATGPWKGYDGPDRQRSELAVLPLKGPTHLITFVIYSVDDQRVGNEWRGRWG